jgi:hypothetical protein
MATFASLLYHRGKRHFNVGFGRHGWMCKEVGYANSADHKKWEIERDVCVFWKKAQMAKKMLHNAS